MSAPMTAGVTQTILYTPENEAAGVYGNCLQAAVATVLDMPLEAVPHFSQFLWWPHAMSLWAAGHGLKVCGERTSVIPDRLCVVGGKSPRGVMHSVVGEHGAIAWDPHPSRAGLAEVRDAAWFEPGMSEDPQLVLLAEVARLTARLEAEVRARHSYLFEDRYGSPWSMCRCAAWDGVKGRGPEARAAHAAHVNEAAAEAFGVQP